jgi:hypothetical protein
LQVLAYAADGWPRAECLHPACAHGFNLGFELCNAGVLAAQLGGNTFRPYDACVVVKPSSQQQRF